MTEIQMLNQKIQVLTGKIYQDWIIAQPNYYDKLTGQYINGGWKKYESENADCAKLIKLQKKLNQLIPPLSVKARLKHEQNYLKSAGLLNSNGQKSQWKQIKQGLVNFKQLYGRK